MWGFSGAYPFRVWLGPITITVQLSLDLSHLEIDHYLLTRWYFRLDLLSFLCHFLRPLDLFFIVWILILRCPFLALYRTLVILVFKKELWGFVGLSLLKDLCVWGFVIVWILRKMGSAVEEKVVAVIMVGGPTKGIHSKHICFCFFLSFRFLHNSKCLRNLLWSQTESNSFLCCFIVI